MQIHKVSSWKETYEQVNEVYYKIEWSICSTKISDIGYETYDFIKWGISNGNKRCKSQRKWDGLPWNICYVC